MENSSEPMPAAPTAAIPVAEGPLPGAALAAARVAQGMSLEDVARQLKLSVAQIRAIEADDYAKLPSPVFVRGFIRTYARTVKLDAAKMVLPRMVAAEAGDSRLMQDAPRASIEPSAYRRAPQIVAGIACVMLALAFYEFVLNAPPVAAPVAGIIRDTPAPVSATPAPAAAAATDAAPAPAAPANTVVAESATPEPAIEPIAATKGREPSKAGAQRVLRFVFGGESWVEVRDGDGKILLSRSNAAGTERVVRGEPPFSVVVGGAGKVKLTYNDSAINLADHADNDVARLQLQ